jgi:hypothetical protein
VEGLSDRLGDIEIAFDGNHAVHDAPSVLGSRERSPTFRGVFTPTDGHSRRPVPPGKPGGH